ncbi:hypothetical protein ACJ41O_001419 [Fusarium nematophilum]
MPLTTDTHRLGPQGMLLHEFEDARTALLKQVLVEAGLLGPKIRKRPTPLKSLGVLDLGFGGGDQTYELFRQTKPDWGWDKFHYVILAQDKAQFEAAAGVYFREAAEAKHLPTQWFRLCPANGAQPGKWKTHVTEVAQSLMEEDLDERWLLVVDGFRSLRAPMLEYAARKLRANFMGFDLILNGEASWRDTLVTKAVGVTIGFPLNSLLTQARYVDRLVDCGYDPDTITIRDISEHVFPEASTLTEQQKQSSSQHGGSLFGWLRRSRVIKAIIVVARIEEGYPAIPAEEKKDGA